MRLALAVLAAAAPWHLFAAGGVTVPVPPGWHATSRPLTPVTSPVEVLAVASFRFPRVAGANGCEPTATLARVGERGALVYLIEYGEGRLRDFPPRPAHFRLGPVRAMECFGRSSVLTFREHGRWFEVQVVLGRRAGAAVRRTVLRILDGLRVA